MVTVKAVKQARSEGSRCGSVWVRFGLEFSVATKRSRGLIDFSEGLFFVVPSLRALFSLRFVQVRVE